jgi:hypothetical protein
MDPNERRLKKPCAPIFLRVYGSNLITYGAKLIIFTKSSLMSMYNLLHKQITKIILRMKKYSCCICLCINIMFTTWDVWAFY